MSAPVTVPTHSGVLGIESRLQYMSGGSEGGVMNSPTN